LTLLPGSYFNKLNYLTDLARNQPPEIQRNPVNETV
jgi:hypothetical protein